MAGKSFSAILQALSNDYFNHSISVDEYRARRRQILEQVDALFNGAPSSAPADTADEIYDPTEPLRLGETLAFTAADVGVAENDRSKDS